MAAFGGDAEAGEAVPVGGEPVVAAVLHPEQGRHTGELRDGPPPRQLGQHSVDRRGGTVAAACWSMAQTARSTSARLSPSPAINSGVWLGRASTRPARSRARTHSTHRVQRPHHPSNSSSRRSPKIVCMVVCMVPLLPAIAGARGAAQLSGPWQGSEFYGPGYTA